MTSAPSDPAALPAGRSRIMGVVNVTPDSFSDGGRFAETEAAVAHGLALAREGADLLDVGGESTRPGAAEVPLDEELERVVPVVRGLASACGVPISVDTRKAEVARAALEAGASWVNDVSAGAHDPDMLSAVARAGCTFVAMHMRGDPGDMQSRARYGDPVEEVRAELEERVQACLKAGIDASRIVLDPGIGFGKKLEHNLALLRGLPRLRTLGYPLLVGVSRKSFIGELTSVDEPEDRLGGTAAAVTASILGGADVLRVHDVAFMVQVVRVADALARPSPPRPSPTDSP